MSTYESEHNTPDPSAASQPQTRRRPDLSSFFALLREITPAENHRPHAVPVPGDVTSAMLSLAESFEVMRREQGGNQDPTQEDPSSDDGLLDQMIELLLSEARSPPREVKGASEEFVESLERIPKSALKSSQTCPICSVPFLEDEYPLVIQLPCHPTHMFDLECIRPWLRVQGTCPLDRFDFAKQEREKKEALKKLAEEDEEEEWDGMYG